MPVRPLTAPGRAARSGSFGQLLRREDTQGLTDGLKWLGAELGKARDAEVLAGASRRRYLRWMR